MPQSLRSETPPAARSRRRALALVGLALLAGAPPSAPSPPAVDLRFVLRLVDHFPWRSVGEIPSPAQSPSAPASATARTWLAHRAELRAELCNRTRDRYLAQFPYGGAIDAAAQRHGLDALLVAAVVEAESGFRPAVVSERGAVGLMQILPETAAGLGGRDLFAPLDPFDPTTNLDLGARYLASLLTRFDGRVDFALAAYHSGPARVERHRGVPPWDETEEYVERVLERLDQHRDALSQMAVAGPAF